MIQYNVWKLLVVHTLLGLLASLTGLVEHMLYKSRTKGWKVRWENILCMLIRNLTGELSDLNSLWIPREGGRLEEYTTEKPLGVETHCIGFNSLSAYHINAHCDAFLIFKFPKRAFREYFLYKMTIVFVCILDSCCHFSHEWWTKPLLLLVHHIAVDTPKEHSFAQQGILLILQGWLFISSSHEKCFICLYWWKTTSITKE